MLQQRRSISLWVTIVLVGFVVLAAFTSEAPVAAQDNESITIQLKEYKNSGVSGTATLDSFGNDTSVAMELSGDPVTGNHPTHIHTGTCANFDPDPTYPLTTVILDDVSDAGTSETTVEGVRLRDLLRADYVILVHKSAEELTNYFVCGDIKMSAAVNHVPGAGIGSANSSLIPAILLSVVAAASAVCSASLRLLGRRTHD